MQKEYIERKQALEILEKSLTFSEIELDKGDFRKGCIAAIQDDISNIRHIPTADVAPKSEVVKILFDLKRQIHDKAVRPHSAGIDAYISLKVFDAVLQNIINKYTEEKK